MQIELIIRLIIAGICGALIGFERRSRSKEAGLRTHFVVAVGSALLMIVSKYGFADVVNGHSIILDPSRIAAQVVSGIGFLGAGMIIVQRQSVRGLTTAAGLWSTAGIGLTIGAGMYWVGFSATGLVLIGLEVLDRGVRFIAKAPRKLVIRITDEPGVMKNVSAVLARMNIEANTFQMQTVPTVRETDVACLDVFIKLPRSVDCENLLQIIASLSGVTQVRVE